MTWSAEQYTQFEAQRTRPVRDLLAAVPPLAARTAVDLGCGPGNSTEALAARFPGATVRGLDNSADMLKAARHRLPALNFELQDIAQWVCRSPHASLCDVILANAVLHWLPDHARLLPALVAKLTAGGALAVQMPDNLDEPAHRAMREIAADGPWTGRLVTAGAVTARAPLATPDRYHAILCAAGCTADIWRTTYHHLLAGGADAVVEWFKGSGLRPYLDELDAAEGLQFLARFRAAVARAYPASVDGSVLLPFPRLFIVALKC